MIRSFCSEASAEGSGKTGLRDQRKFYAIARGSAMECGAIEDVCKELGFVGGDVCEKAKSKSK